MRRWGIVGVLFLAFGCGDGVRAFDIAEGEGQDPDIIGTVFLKVPRAGATVFVNRPDGTIYEVWTIPRPPLDGEGEDEFEERFAVAVPNGGAVTYTDGRRYLTYFSVLPRDRLVFSNFATENSAATVVTAPIPSPDVPKEVLYNFWGCESVAEGPERRQLLVLRGDCGKIGSAYDLMGFATTPAGEPLAYASKQGIETGREALVQATDWRSDFLALPLARESLPTTAGRTASVLMRTGDTYFRTPGAGLSQDSRMLWYPPVGKSYAVSYERADPMAGDKTIIGLGNTEEPFALERPSALIVDLASGRVHWQPGSGSDGHVLRFAWNEAGQRGPVEWILAGPAEDSELILPLFYKDRRPMPTAEGGFLRGEVGSVEFSDFQGYEDMIFSESGGVLFQAFEARMGRPIAHYESGGTARLATQSAMYR